MFKPKDSIRGQVLGQAMVLLMVVAVLAAIIIPLTASIIRIADRDSCINFLQTQGYWVLAAGECVDGTLAPCTDNAHDLGQPGLRWQDVRLANELHVNNRVLTDSGSQLRIDSYAIPRTATVTVAASDSAAACRAQADYVCSGVNDEVAIQVAIDALPANGGIVQLMEGIYDIAAPIEIDSYVTLRGLGEATRLKASANMAGVIINKDWGVANCLYFAIENLSIDGNGQTLNGIDIRTPGVSEVYSHGRIEKCHIHSCVGHAVFFDYAGASKFHDNYFGSFLGGLDVAHNTGDGLHIEHSNDALITSNHSLCNGGYGIYINACIAPTITGNFVVHNTNNGVHIRGDTHFGVITGNLVGANGGTYGIVITGVAGRCTITGNTLLEEGILLTGGSRLNTISGNTVASSDDTGVYIEDSCTNSVLANFITNCARGIVVHGSFEIGITSNVLRNHTNESILVESGGFNPSEILIGDNLIVGGTIGISIEDADDASITDNRIKGSTTPININNVAVVRCMVMGNDWEGCTNDMDSAAATTPRITSNIDLNGAWYTVDDQPITIEAWITHTTMNPSLGTIPAGSYVMRIHCHVTELFDSDGTDQITVGYDVDPDAFATVIDVSTTGIKVVTLGAEAGYEGTTRAVETYYTAGGSAATQGKALIKIELQRVPTSP